MSDTKLAIHGGNPVRQSFLPYSRQTVNEADRQAVLRVLDSDFLTTGPEVEAFEKKLGTVTDGAAAAAVSSGTAALHGMLDGYRTGPGDEVIVPAITFAATANAALYVGATPVFADVDPSTLLIDPLDVDRLITKRTRAVIAVDFAGQPANYASLRSAIPERVHLLSDAAHSIGGSANGVKVGALAESSCFSFHPVKPVAAGEGGAVVSSDEEIIASVKSFRSHGIDADHAARARGDTWKYSMVRLGYNYRLTDLQCALAASQLDMMEGRRLARERLASQYDRWLSDLPGVTPLSLAENVTSAHHLYVVLLDTDMFTVGRDEIFAALRAENIGVNVHYIPVPMHPYYQQQGAHGGPWPRAYSAFERMLSLPLWSGMSQADAEDVIGALNKVTAAFKR